MVAGRTSGNGDHTAKVVVSCGLEAAKATDGGDLDGLGSGGGGLWIPSDARSIGKGDNDVLLAHVSPGWVVIVINKLANILRFATAAAVAVVVTLSDVVFELQSFLFSFVLFSFWDQTMARASFSVSWYLTLGPVKMSTTKSVAWLSQ